MSYAVEPLTKEEKQWIKKLEKVLNSCPSSRLHLTAYGDPTLNVIDGDVVKEYDLEIHDGLVESNGVLLGLVFGKVPVHSTTA